MNIHTNNTPTYQPLHFQAKIPLNEIRNVVSPKQIGNSKIDTMFKRNFLTKTLENASIYLRKNIGNEYFMNPTNKIEQFGKYLVDKSVKFTRTLANKISFVCNKSGIKNLNNNFAKMNPNSAEYIEELAKVGNTLNKKYIITNIESNTLKDISKSNESTIFVLNHPNFHKDKFVYVILNSMLNKMYVNEGKQLICPRPKILVSKYMLTMLGKKMGNIYKQLGLVEVDPAVKNRKIASNAIPMKQLLKEFVQDKSNVFIFPEGNNSALKNKSFEEKIQPGVADFVKQACKLKKEVRVVPIGINYTNDKNCIGKIFIGEPMYFQKGSEETIFSQNGKIESLVSTNPKESTGKILNKICNGIKDCIKNATELE